MERLPLRFTSSSATLEDGSNGNRSICRYLVHDGKPESGKRCTLPSEAMQAQLALTAVIVL